MMFKGTISMGIKPGTLAKDAEYDRQIDALEAKVVEEESKVTGRDDARIMAWKKEVSDLLTTQKAETSQRGDLGRYQKAGAPASTPRQARDDAAASPLKERWSST
jgi:hypothetical protein